MTNTFKTLTPLAWRNLWRNPRRTAITLIVVSVGLWSILFFNSFLNAWSQSSKDATLAQLIGQGQIHAVGYLDDPNIDKVMSPPDAALTAALETPSIQAWASRLQLPGVVQSEYKTLPVSLVGVDPAAEARVSSIPGKVVEGRYLTGLEDDGVVLGLHLAERLKTGLGRRVILMSQSKDGTLAEQSFDVVGLFDADQQTEDFYAFTGREAAQRFLGLETEISEVVFTIPEAAALESTIVAIGIVNTQLMAVFERTHEFGLLRALGMKPRLVLIMVALESALLIGFGVLIGMGVSALSIWALYDGIDLSAFAKGLEMFQGGQVLYPKYDPKGFVMFSAIIWVLGILVALWPARRASKSSPVEAMRHAS
jgi:ABC-type lipoprotein release transport system permease subunit